MNLVCKWAESRRSIAVGSIRSVLDEMLGEQVRLDCRKLGTPEQTSN